MKITVIGLGYAGAVAGLSDAGHNVVGVDIDCDRALSTGSVPLV